MAKKIYELSTAPELLRRAFWAELVPQLAEAQFVEINIDESSLRKQWKEIGAQADVILVDEQHSSFLLKIIPGVSRRILEVGRIDIILKDKKGNLWPDCLVRDSLREQIIAKAPNLDTSAIAYITGDQPMMRVAVSVAVQLGYRTVNLIAEDTNLMGADEGIFPKMYFETQVKKLKNTDLTLQKNDGTLLINTMDLALHNELAEDLTFLNFIYGEGLVVDTQDFQWSNSVLDEAQHVGLRVLRGVELQALTDFKILKGICTSLGVQLSIGAGEYSKKWIESVKQNPAKGPVTK